MITPGDVFNVLPSGYKFVVAHNYGPVEAESNVLPVIISVFELITSSGLFAAILVSAWNTRNSTSERLFVRTRVAAFLTPLLFCQVLSAIGQIISISWISRSGVFMGSLCTAQAIIKHFSDVGIALWNLTIAIHSFGTLWRWSRPRDEVASQKQKQNFVVWFGRPVPHKEFVKWLLFASVWAIIVIVFTLGPAIGSTGHNGDFYGVWGEWCYVTDGYLGERVAFGYALMILSATVSICLFFATVFSVLRALQVRLMDTEDGKYENIPEENEAYSVMLAKFMIWFPLVYFCCVLPVIIVRFIYWAGVSIPFGATVFTDAVYHLLGILDTVLFVSTPGLLPPESLQGLQFWKPRPEPSQSVTAILATGSWLRELKNFPDSVADRRPAPLDLGGSSTSSLRDPSAPPPLYIDDIKPSGDAGKRGDTGSDASTPLSLLRGRVKARNLTLHEQQRAASAGSGESHPRIVPRRPVPAYWELENWVEPRTGAERQVVVQSAGSSPHQSAHAVPDVVEPTMKRCSSASIIEMRPAATQGVHLAPPRRVRFDLATQSPAAGDSAASVGSYFAGAQAEALATRVAPPVQRSLDFPTSAINTITAEMTTVSSSKGRSEKQELREIDVDDLEIEWECREVVEGSGEWECTEKVRSRTVS